jgi:hypothetical protein
MRGTPVDRSDGVGRLTINLSRNPTTVVLVSHLILYHSQNTGLAAHHPEFDRRPAATGTH